MYLSKNDRLSDGQRRAVLSLISKKNRDLRYLKSWRPVSLIAILQRAKALANQLQKVTGYLIGQNQVRYIKGRLIGENVQITDNMLQHTNKISIPGLLVLIDFKKVFNKIEWDFLFNALKVLTLE